MNVVTPEELKACLDNARTRYLATVRAIAADVREQLVVPACQKHRLSFRGASLPLDYYFFRMVESDVLAETPNDLIVARNASTALRVFGFEVAQDLAPIFAVLRIDADMFSEIGHRVEDVP